ncbi:MAG: hypothetical protein HRT35_23780 [Algicola sp.]|nr:hypothetical protein [Algicola sp.]
MSENEITLSSLSKKQLGLNWAMEPVLWVTGILVLGAMVMYCHWVVNMLSASYMVLAAKHIRIKASYPFGSKEQTYLIEDIDKITFGANLSVVEKAALKLEEYNVIHANTGLIKDVNAGKLKVETKTGKKKTYNFVDKCFDSTELVDFLRLLQARNVAIHVNDV